jgi:DNA-binding NarL/FixJ family response regulator
LLSADFDQVWRGEALKDKTLRPDETLTARERMIMALVAQGLSNADIAAELKISKQTVKNRLGSIFGKVGVWSRLELAAWLFAHDCKLCPLRTSNLPRHQKRISSDLPLSIPGEAG